MSPPLSMVDAATRFAGIEDPAKAQVAISAGLVGTPTPDRAQFSMDAFAFKNGAGTWFVAEPSTCLVWRATLTGATLTKITTGAGTFAPPIGWGAGNANITVRNSPKGEWDFSAATVTGLPGGGSVPTGTGFRHVTAGVEDAASKLVENADLHATAAIALTKLATIAASAILANITGGAATPVAIDIVGDLLPILVAQMNSLARIANGGTSGDMIFWDAGGGEWVVGDSSGASPGDVWTYGAGGGGMPGWAPP